MSHMQPEVKYETFLVGETTEGTTLLHPDVWGEKKRYTLLKGERWRKRKGWYARLSAPGYTDCTDWSGPFKTELDGHAHLEEMYGSDEEQDEFLDDIERRVQQAIDFIDDTELELGEVAKAKVLKATEALNAALQAVMA